MKYIFPKAAGRGVQVPGILDVWAEDYSTIFFCKNTSHLKKKKKKKTQNNNKKTSKVLSIESMFKYQDLRYLSS